MQVDELLDKLSQSERYCREDAEDVGGVEPDERAFYAGQAEGYRLAAQWLREALILPCCVCGPNQDTTHGCCVHDSVADDTPEQVLDHNFQRTKAPCGCDWAGCPDCQPERYDL